MSEIDQLHTITHQYRDALEAFHKRTGAPTQAVESRGSGEEREKISRMDADLDAIEQRYAQLAARKAAEARIAELEAKLAEPQFRAAAPAKAVANDIASPEYAQRWLKAVARGDAAEMRALSLSTAGAGIPTDMERRIIEKMYQANVLRQMCPITTIDSNRTLTVEGNLPTSAWVAEAGAIAPADPTFGTAISITPRKIVCRTTLSQEFIEDAIGQGGIGSGLDWVASRIGMSLALKMEQGYTVGNNAATPAEPQGICLTDALPAGQRTDLGAGVALTTATGDNLIDTVHLVAPQYRSSSRFSWLISDAFLKHVRKIKVNTTDYVWKIGNEGGLTNGAPGTIYGVPYRIGQYVPTTTAANAVYAVVGDFNYYEIFDRTGMTSMVDPYSAAANHQVNLYTYARTDAKIMNSDAFAAIVG
jgi:HK97 family phage major capsid protein